MIKVKSTRLHCSWGGLVCSSMPSTSAWPLERCSSGPQRLPADKEGYWVSLNECQKETDGIKKLSASLKATWHSANLSPAMQSSHLHLFRSKVIWIRADAVHRVLLVRLLTFPAALHCEGVIESDWLHLPNISATASLQGQCDLDLVTSWTWVSNISVHATCMSVTKRQSK